MKYYFQESPPPSNSKNHPEWLWTPVPVVFCTTVYHLQILSNNEIAHRGTMDIMAEVTRRLVKEMMEKKMKEWLSSRLSNRRSRPVTFKMTINLQSYRGTRSAKNGKSVFLTAANTAQRCVVSVPGDVWFGVSIFHFAWANLGGGQESQRMYLCLTLLSGCEMLSVCGSVLDHLC